MFSFFIYLLLLFFSFPSSPLKLLSEVIRMEICRYVSSL